MDGYAVMEPVTMMAISTAITVGSKLAGFFSQKEAAQKAADRLNKKKDTIMQGKVGIGMAFEGEMQLGEERYQGQMDKLTQLSESKLADFKTKQQDAGSTFAGSGIEKRGVEKAEESVWDNYLMAADDLKTKKEDVAIGAYGKLGQGVGNVEKDFDALKAEIDSLLG